MPEYSFNCSECDSAFSEVVSNYVKGLHEASTLGEYADKQVKKLGKSKVEQMRRDQKTKKKKTLESKLPSGMSKTSYENTARISKSEMLKRRNGK